MRPFGVCTLLAAFDHNGPQLYMVDPAGTMHKYYATAVGKGRQAAKNELEKLKMQDMTCKEAVFAAAKILHQVHDEEKGFELEVAVISTERLAKSSREFQRKNLQKQKRQPKKQSKQKTWMTDIYVCSLYLVIYHTCMYHHLASQDI